MSLSLLHLLKHYFVCLEITHNKPRNNQPEKGNMDTKELHMMTISPVINSKPVHYVSDGTGRDSYIVRSSGGLFNEYNPGSTKNSFYTSLRNYDRTIYNRKSLSPRRSDKNDVFRKSQSHFNSTTKSNFNKIKTYQQMMTNRLSKPKRKNVKRLSI